MKITTQGKKRLIAELILVVLILAIALPFIVFYATRPRGTTARVKLDGKLVGEYSLSVNAEYSLNGGTNILVIEDGCAFVSYADCPKQFCVNEGKKYRSGQTIACRHNKVVIEIVGGESDVDLES